MKNSLKDENEVLFRQVHPDLFDKGEPNSSVFKPKPKDKDKVSVDRSSMTDAKQAHSLYVGSGYASVAVYGLNVGEFGVEKVVCVGDPIPECPPKPANPAHALADYSPHSPSKQKVIAKRLKQKALMRGRLFP